MLNYLTLFIFSSRLVALKTRIHLQFVRSIIAPMDWLNYLIIFTIIKLWICKPKLDFKLDQYFAFKIGGSIFI